ncbi:hypothetical protein RFI_33314 [Reticulomyxa filosa]|uniref:Uncharacterized protein n=1 Tax=Reticulomyxa filosa TaxID=46433 RepID=X6LTM9_RETFI|nr:hypothetical protein RFI_33314 [Reticulomyxa filosa]|eukprot:ETO04090.1 hypothetical protein RFI_33314 [Reticulomyxa filosa]
MEMSPSQLDIKNTKATRYSLSTRQYYDVSVSIRIPTKSSVHELGNVMFTVELYGCKGGARAEEEEEERKGKTKGKGRGRGRGKRRGREDAAPVEDIDVDVENEGKSCPSPQLGLMPTYTQRGDVLLVTKTKPLLIEYKSWFIVDYLDKVIFFCRICGIGKGQNNF